MILSLKTFKMHALVWTYYKDRCGDYRCISPIQKQDRGPFKRLRDLRSYVAQYGRNINFQ